MARNKGKDPNKLGFGRLMAFKSSDIVAAWINLIMLNYLSIYASDTLGVNLLTVSTLLLASKAAVQAMAVTRLAKNPFFDIFLLLDPIFSSSSF